MLRVGLVFLIALGSFSCSYRIDKNPATSESMPSFTKGELSYALVDQYVLAPKCIQCHGNSGGINLENYSEVKRNIRGVEAAALVTFAMPKSPVTALSEAQRAMLQDWISIGAPEFPNGGIETPPPPLAPTFASIHDQIFAAKCMLCHNPNGSAKKVSLDTAADLLAAPNDLVLPGDPDNSYLTIIISPGARRPMPPASSGISLSEDEVNVIKEWIKNGAKD